jgi:hypothetical protein
MNDPSPGWYPDPERPGLARYFDGSAWTEHLRPVDEAPGISQPGAPRPEDAIEAPPPRRRRGRTIGIVVAVVALLAALGGAALMLFDRSEGEVATVATTAPATTATTRPDRTTETTAEGPDDTAGDAGSSGTTTGATATVAPKSLSTLEPVDSEHTSGPDTGVVQVNGQQFTDAVFWSSSNRDPSWVEYDLGRKFQTFTAVAGFNQEADAQITGIVRVIGDGRELISAPISLGQVAPIDVSVAGVLRLRIELTYTAEDEDGYLVDDGAVVLGDAELAA